MLARDGHARSVETKIRSRTDALLRGLLYAPSGERMNLIWFQRNPLPVDWEAQRQIVKRFEEEA